MNWIPWINRRELQTAKTWTISEDCDIEIVEKLVKEVERLQAREKQWEMERRERDRLRVEAFWA